MGLDWSGLDWNGREWMGEQRNGEDGRGQDWTGSGRMGPERIGKERTAQDRKEIGMAKVSNIMVTNEDTFIDDSVLEEPYSVKFTIQGTRAYLFNRYDVPVVTDTTNRREKQAPALGTMVTLDSKRHLAARSVQVWNAVVAAGKYRKNPRNARGSFATVLKEGIEIEGLDEGHPDLLTFTDPKGKPYDSWEFEYTARTKHGGAFASYVTKVRPAINPGWLLSGRIVVMLPQYIKVGPLHEALEMAGRFGGIGDGRTGGLGFGRFRVVKLEEDQS